LSFFEESGTAKGIGEIFEKIVTIYSSFFEVAQYFLSAANRQGRKQIVFNNVTNKFVSICFAFQQGILFPAKCYRIHLAFKFLSASLPKICIQSIKSSLFFQEIIFKNIK